MADISWDSLLLYFAVFVSGYMFHAIWSFFDRRADRIAEAAARPSLLIRLRNQILLLLFPFALGVAAAYYFGWFK
jgi:4-hydroxybenzoate polyprenyltransferase